MNDFKNHFEKFRQLVYNKYGINFSDAKEGLLDSKVQKLMTRNEIGTFNEYYRSIRIDL